MPEVAIRQAVSIKIDNIHPNTWNANVQKNATFDKLVEEIQEDGFKDPLTVVPIDKSDYESEWTSGVHYRIISGEHRWRAAKVLDYKELPCFVEEEWDEQLQKLKTVRLNLIKGDLDSTKFTKLVKELEQDVDPVILPDLLGFNDGKEMSKYIIEEAESRDKTFLDGLLQESKKEKYAIDSLTEIIADIFNQTAGTVDQNYLFFSYKGGLHMAIIADKKLFALLKDVNDYLVSSGESATDFFTEAIETHFDASN